MSVLAMGTVVLNFAVQDVVYLHALVQSIVPRVQLAYQGLASMQAPDTQAAPSVQSIVRVHVGTQRPERQSSVPQSPSPTHSSPNEGER